MVKGFCRNGHNLFPLGRDNSGHCYVCRRERDRIRSREPGRKLRIRQAVKRWNARNPEWLRNYGRQWQHSNPERVQQYQRLYYNRNKEARMANSRRWLRQHPEMQKNYNARTRGLSYRPTMLLPQEEITQLLDYYGRQCAYCGGEFQELDHLQPLVRGGAHQIENLAPSCRPCNRSKGARPIWTMLKVS